MDLYPGLTKENYFDELEKLYPNAGKTFKEFIDDYKASTNWKELFNVVDKHIQKNGSDWEVEKTEAPKFHDLPYHLQIGIIENFMLIHGLLCEIFPVQTFDPKGDNRWQAGVVKIFNQEAWNLFTDHTFTELAGFEKADEARAECFKLGFAILENMIVSRAAAQN